MTISPLIEIEGLRVIFHGDDGRITHAVDRVDLSVARGATLGLVGESGCGKSVTSARSVSTVLICLKCRTRRCATCAAIASQ